MLINTESSRYILTIIIGVNSSLAVANDVYNHLGEPIMIDISQLHQDPDSYEMIDENGHIYIFNGTYFLDGKIPDIGTDEESLNFALPCKETLLKTMNIEEGDNLQPEINDCYIQRITNDEYEIVPIKYLPKPNQDKANYYMPGENSYGPHRRLDVFQQLIM